MAFDDTSPPKKRWQQQKPSFSLDANQWRHQSVLIRDQTSPNIYHLGSILDIIDSHLVKLSFRNEQMPSTTIDIHQSTDNCCPVIIIDNIPACHDLSVDTRVCVRRDVNEDFNRFVCGRIREKHSARLEYSIEFDDSNENQQEDKWFTRQNLRLLIEPWQEELRLFQQNENDEIQKAKSQLANKFAGLKKGDVFTVG